MASRGRSGEGEHCGTNASSSTQRPPRGPRRTRGRRRAASDRRHRSGSWGSQLRPSRKADRRSAGPAGSGRQPPDRGRPAARRQRRRKRTWLQGPARRSHPCPRLHQRAGGRHRHVRPATEHTNASSASASSPTTTHNRHKIVVEHDRRGRPGQMRSANSRPHHLQWHRVVRADKSASMPLPGRSQSTSSPAVERRRGRRPRRGPVRPVWSVPSPGHPGPAPSATGRPGPSSSTLGARRAARAGRPRPPPSPDRTEDARGGAVARPRHGGWRRPGASVRP